MASKGTLNDPFGVQMTKNVNCTLAKEVEVLFYKVLPDIRNRGLLQCPRLRPLVFLERAAYRKSEYRAMVE
jgi:hypothetical protein